MGRAEARTAFIAQGRNLMRLRCRTRKKRTKLQIKIDKCKKNRIFLKKIAKKFA